jgi:hypothetical protein
LPAMVASAKGVPAEEGASALTLTILLMMFG